MNELNVRRSLGTYLVKTFTGSYKVELLGKGTPNVRVSNEKHKIMQEVMTVEGSWIKVGQRMKLESPTVGTIKTTLVLSIEPK